MSIPGLDEAKNTVLAQLASVLASETPTRGMKRSAKTAFANHSTWQRRRSALSDAGVQRDDLLPSLYVAPAAYKWVEGNPVVTPVMGARSVATHNSGDLSISSHQGKGNVRVRSVASRTSLDHPVREPVPKYEPHEKVYFDGNGVEIDASPRLTDLREENPVRRGERRNDEVKGEDMCERRLHGNIMKGTHTLESMGGVHSRTQGPNPRRTGDSTPEDRLAPGSATTKCHNATEREYDGAYGTRKLLRGGYGRPSGSGSGTT